MNEIEQFIEKFRNDGTIEVFTRGCCYWFAYVLASRFLMSEIAYNPVENHFAMRMGSELYDITGKIEGGEGWMDWDEYQEVEPDGAERVRACCVDIIGCEKALGLDW